MDKTTSDYLISLLLVSIFISVIACQSSTAQYHMGNARTDSHVERQSSSKTGVKTEAERRKPSLANPAATRCVNDGYTLEPVIKNGVSVDYMCVNPETGLRCEIWKYFRHECSLEK